jgi:hypothetical protein
MKPTVFAKSPGDTATLSCQYRVDRISLEQVEDRGTAGASSRSPTHNPEWVKGYFADELENLSTYSVSQSNSVVGTVFFLLLNWPRTWYLGEFAIADLPLKRLRMLGGDIGIPDDAAAYDALFAELQTRPDYDCLYFEEVPTASFLWKYLHTDEKIRHRFVAYQPEPPAPRPILQLGESFEGYMQKFSPKHRNTIRRKIKKLGESPFGQMRLVRYESPDQVPEFLDQAIEVSRKTYQWKIHQRGLSATETVRRRLSFAAEHGWMRCYLLFCGEKPYAFLTGYQHEGCFLLDEIGHDPALSKYSAGTVLQYMVVEDLFAHNRPIMWDLQDYGHYKGTLSTDSFDQGKIFLFKPGSYSHLVISGDRLFRSITGTTSRLLDRLKLKNKVKNLIRSRIESDQ